MARKTTRVYVTQLNKGLDTDIATSMIDEKSAVDLLNVRWNEGGIIMKRDGHSDVFSTLTNPKKIGNYISATKREILAIDGTALKITTLDSGVWTTPATTVTFSDTAELYDIQNVKRNTYIWNGVDAGAVYDGTSVTRPGTMPNAQFSTEYKGYHIAAGTKAQPSRVYFSTINNASDFTNHPDATTDGPDPDNSTEVPGATVFEGTVPDVAQFVDISLSDGEPITLLKEFEDFLIICKTNSIWSMTIDGESKKPVIQLISRSAGCVSYQTGVPIGNDLYFLSEQGPLSLGNERNYMGSLRTNLLAENIKRIVDRINPEQWSRSTAVYYDRMYILSIPYGDSSIINRVLMLDTRFNAWSIWDNINARSWLSFVDDKNKRHLYFLKEGATNISEMLSGHYYDNGQPIVAFWRSKAIDAGALDVTKRFTYFTVFMRNVGATADVTINTELERLEPINIFGGTLATGLGFKQWGTESWIGLTSDAGNTGEDSGISTSDDAWRTQPNMEARTFTFEVRNAKGGENFYLSGFSLEYVTLKAYYFDQANTF